MSRMSLTRWLNQQGLSVYVVVLGCLLLGPWSEAGMEYFSLDRQALEDDEYWRFWSGHFVHLSWTHLLLNSAGLVLLQQLFGDELKRYRWLLGCALISPFIGICWLRSVTGNWLPIQGYDYVVGLSGLLHGLFIYAACLALRRDLLLGAGVLVFIGAKAIGENVFGPAEFTANLVGLPVAIDMHIYGIVAGIILGVLTICFSGNR